MEIVVGSFFGLCLTIWFVQWLRKDHKKAEEEVDDLDNRLHVLEEQATQKVQADVDDAQKKYEKSFEIADKMLKNEFQIIHTNTSGGKNGQVLVHDGEKASFQNPIGPIKDTLELEKVKAKTAELQAKLDKLEAEQKAEEEHDKKVKFGTKWGKRLKGL